MKTEDLIAALSLELEPAIGVRRRLVGAAALGALAAGVLMVAWLGLRPDYPAAFGKPMFWMKAAYAGLIALGGFIAVERLSRPGGSARKGWSLLAAVLAVWAAVSLWRLGGAPAADRMGMVMGETWRVCPRNILVLSLPLLAVTILAVRALAPTRLVLAGAACGLLAGGLAALVYGLHCPESTMPFVAVWYSLGISASVLIGAALGPWVLRWR